jgi:hypothetical protein
VHSAEISARRATRCASNYERSAAEDARQRETGTVGQRDDFTEGRCRSIDGSARVGDNCHIPWLLPRSVVQRGTQLRPCWRPDPGPHSSGLCSCLAGTKNFAHRNDDSRRPSGRRTRRYVTPRRNCACTKNAASNAAQSATRARLSLHNARSHNFNACVTTNGRARFIGLSDEQ